MKKKAINIIQTRLFEPERPILKRQITYSSLSIHQKINYKANQCGFQSVVYLSRYNYFAAPLHQPEYECLTKRYAWHYNANSGGMNRIDNWIKNKNAQKQLFKN